MGFDQLLGNEQLKDNLRSAAQKGRLSHFYLISGPEGSGKHTLARLLSAALLCGGNHRPCMGCNACRKVMANTHPDLITVTDPEHKNVAVRLVREMRDDMFIRPNEGEKKIYLFPQELGIEGQNALLKILEEPPSYGVFILLTDSPEKLLPTVRSRATELRLQGLPREVLRTQLQKDFPQADEESLEAAMDRSGGYLGQAKTILEQGDSASEQTENFLNAFAHKDAVLLTTTLVAMERLNRDKLLPELTVWAEHLQQALVCRSGSKVALKGARDLAAARSSAELLSALRCVQKSMDYLQGNVSGAAICGYLAWALR